MYLLIAFSGHFHSRRPGEIKAHSNMIDSCQLRDVIKMIKQVIKRWGFRPFDKHCMPNDANNATAGGYCSYLLIGYVPWMIIDRLRSRMGECHRF